MPIADRTEQLASAVDFAPGASGGSGIIGTAIAVTDSDIGAGLRKGVVYAARMSIAGAVSGTSPTLAVVIQAEDEDTSWFNIGVFPTLGAAGTPFPNASIVEGLGYLYAFFQVPNKTYEVDSDGVGKDVIAVRAFGTTTGTSTPTYNDIDIDLLPAINGELG